MYWHKTPTFIQWLYPNLIWHKSRSEKCLYVTFDDGPIPEITPTVLDILDRYNAKGTFFCVGDNISKYPEIYQQVINRGHMIANHTFNHLNGWKTEVSEYLSNISLCQDLITADNEGKQLFRPPYGKIKKRAARQLHSTYEIIMWDVLSGDFDQNLSPEKCLANTIDATRAGSIVIFHDSLKAKHNILYALPKYLEHFTHLGYNFKGL